MTPDWNGLTSNSLAVAKRTGFNARTDMRMRKLPELSPLVCRSCAPNAENVGKAWRKPNDFCDFLGAILTVPKETRKNDPKGTSKGSKTLFRHNFEP